MRMKDTFIKKRCQLQIDVDSTLKRIVKQLALREGVSLRELVLDALASQHRELEPAVSRELGRGRGNQP